MLEVQRCIDVPVAIEPPPFTHIVGSMALMTYFAELSNHCDCAILLDVGHLVSYEMASGRRIADELENFPFDRVIEVHIAGGKIISSDDGDIYIDAHEHEVLAQSWAMLEFLLPKLSNVKAICYECEGVDADQVLATLSKLRQRVLADVANADIVEKIVASNKARA